VAASLEVRDVEPRLIVEHYNRCHPSMSLTGRTPDEACFSRELAVETARWEPRAK
jgi:hypothetical protein